MQDFKTFEEQLDILKQRGLIIKNETDVINKLISNNYYNVINGYKDLFCHKNNAKEYFNDGVTFDNVFSLYKFDCSLKPIILRFTLIIENELRTLIAYVFSKYHGVENYLKYTNFDYLTPSEASYKKVLLRAKQINKLISKVHNDLSYSIDKKDYIKHYIINHGYVPLWVLVNCLPLNRLSEFYKSMKQKERVEIATHFNLKENDLASFLDIIVFYRNLAAHDDRVYNSKFTKSIPDSIYHKKLNLPIIFKKDTSRQYPYGKNDMLAFLIACKCFLQESDFNTLVNKINSQLSRLKTKIDINVFNNVREVMGLKTNWVNIKSIEILHKRTRN